VVFEAFVDELVCAGDELQVVHMVELDAQINICVYDIVM
jgi:hypothetical protein